MMTMEGDTLDTAAHPAVMQFAHVRLNTVATCVPTKTDSHVLLSLDNPAPLSCSRSPNTLHHQSYKNQRDATAAATDTHHPAAANPREQHLLSLVLSSSLSEQACARLS